MRRLAEAFAAGALDQPGFVAEMVAFPWRAPHWVIPDELAEASPQAKLAWGRSVSGLPMAPDSLDEVWVLVGEGLIDRFTLRALARAWVAALDAGTVDGSWGLVEDE